MARIGPVSCIGLDANDLDGITGDSGAGLADRTRDDDGHIGRNSSRRARAIRGPVAQRVPHTGAAAGSLAKPLNERGAGPPLRAFASAHYAPQKVTVEPEAAFPSPITKLPPSDKP